MATSPPRNAPHIPPFTTSTGAHLTSPRSTRTLRKLQSAQALSSQYTAAGNAPSLISQQRQLQHRSSAILRPSGPPPLLEIPPLLENTAWAPTQRPSSSRTRANSEATAAGMTNANGTVPPKRSAPAKKIVGADANSRDEIEILLRQGPKGDVLGSLASLRQSVLLDGLVADSDGMSHLRIYIWLILLNAPPLPTDTYLALIHRGPSPAYAKIRNDTFRTLATDPLFKRRVSEASLIRLLNALAWTLHDAHSIPPHPSPAAPPLPNQVSSEGANGLAAGVYVQGMNVLSAPFLYAARSETEAYIALTHLLTHHLPAYILPTLDGVHRGLALLDRILPLIDPKLAAHLQSHSLSASIYAFPSVLTLCACTPPLPEVLLLWDFLFAYGVHLNILCIVAQLVLCREEVLGSERPGGVLRGFPPLRAKVVVEMAVSFVGRLEAGVYEELVGHVK